MPKGASFLTAIFIPFLAGNLATADELETNAQKLSYIIGYQFGQTMQQQGIELDKKALMLALDDVSNKKLARLSPEQAKEVMQAMQQKEQQQHTQQADNNKVAGESYLKANKAKEGVVELPSGLQYKIIQPGNGKIPTADDTVEVNYQGTLINGTEFDSSYKRGKPITFKVSNVIPGWQEALKLMPVGSKWELAIPPKLAYGEQGAGHVIGPNETLLFNIELLNIK
ncbi:peptidyl-prolyl isomerase [Candidatus Nitrosoglobus terrae]|uniref:Peptidyl-prolyl cis-trans isomerase n=1 Tax=Candidatus Nitrosoglobus terrae TaxID=1630141 RepID=A0A1Q2SLZ5_9GAMM|nr:FKBP-type peptidyl-prolyl cis-trans isomerase [Candidatus Nitrosoglobus terrae]BAW80165.1 peptidyl-prolyl isomerase [Candidatus Nitrosoglobus terrae]